MCTFAEGRAWSKRKSSRPLGTVGCVGSAGCSCLEDSDFESAAWQNALFGLVHMCRDWLVRQSTGLRESDYVPPLLGAKAEPLARFGVCAKGIHIVAATNCDAVPQFLGDGPDVLNDTLPMRAVSMSHGVVG